MAANGVKLIPLDGMNLDVAPQYLKATQARFIKNLYYQLSDLGDAGTTQGANTGVLKPLPSNEIYCPISLPEGNNHVIGTLPSRETNELYVLVYNSEKNHLVFVINGVAATCTIIKIDPCFNFQLEPQYFVGEGQIYLEVSYLTDPATNKQIVKKDLYWTDGFNYQNFLRVGDSMATNGFDANLFPYFAGSYDKCSLIRMGLPTPNDCIKIEEEPFNPLTDIGKNDNIKFSSWQFRILRTDVFGRPSEHGIISDLFFLAINECLGASDMLSRCVNLTFDAGNPIIDKVQIEYRNCNDEQWYLDSVLELYEGSNLGEWWLRPRNSNLTYDPIANKITYSFCKDKLCDPIPTSQTNRTQNELPRTSQALTKIGRDIALSNNKDRFSPLAKSELDKISVEIIKPVPSTVGETVNITVWIRIFNQYLGTFQKVWKKDADYVFGGIASNNRGIQNIKTDYQQNFAVAAQKGYLGYLAGTNDYAIGVQYYLDSSNQFIKDDDFTEDISKQYFLKFEFNGIAKGNYIFRLASHLADPNNIDIKTTSTYVNGVVAFSNFTTGAVISNYKEVIINACNADYDTLTSGEMLIALDMTRPVMLAGLSVSQVTVLDGYVYEKVNPLTQVYELPIELLQVSVGSALGDSLSHSNVNSGITDHNGFYFAGSLAHGFTVKMIGYCSCLKKELVRGDAGNYSRRYIQNMVVGLTSQQGFTSSCSDYEKLDCSRVSVTGIIKECITGTPIPNVNVVLSRGGVSVTDVNGVFTITAHDDCVNPTRLDKLYVMGGGCAFTACDGGCIEVKDIIIAPCNNCNVRTLDVGNYEVLFTSNRGLLNGGRFGTCLTMYDWLGRHSFAQTEDKLYFTTPSITDTKTFGFSTVNVIVPPSVTFPDWVDYFTIGITLELNYAGNYISWITDKVEFVDNSGKINDTAPTQIKIYYSSLNEFNTKNNFNTTTGWQIIPESTTSPRTADVVQFIRNGDGTFFNSAISALVKYDQAGEYFLINYTSALKNLKENSLIRLANPQECASKDLFFELCSTKTDVVDGKAQRNKITLNAFDTYFQYRQIPVPVTTVSGTVSSTIIELRQFGFPFESPSITDFYGYKCQNIGRINIRNPYESELIHLDQIALSGVSSVTGQLSYLNYFEEDKKIDFNVNSTGGIVYVRVKTSVVFIICQFKNFVVGFGDNIARLAASGIIQVPSADDQFGKPERANDGDYGCQIFDKNTIRERDGSTIWLDTNRVAILHNGVQSDNYISSQQTTDISRYNKSNSTIFSWLTKKIKYIQEYNRTHENKIYWHSVINPINTEWILTNFTIGADDFVNEEREIVIEKNESIALDIKSQVWKSFYAFTYEYYSYLENSGSGQILFSFKKGMPYSHSIPATTQYNTFSGIKTESIYRFIFNTDGFKKKQYLSMAVYCVEQKLWSDLILTETQQSRLLKSQWKKGDYFYSAPFLCDLNTVADLNIKDETGINKLTDGDRLFGSYIDIRLIADSDGNYFQVYGVIVFAFGEEQTGA